MTYLSRAHAGVLVACGIIGAAFCGCDSDSGRFSEAHLARERVEVVDLDTTSRRSEAVVDLTIGAVDGPPAYTFGQIGGVIQDRRGRIFVVDARTDEVRVFSPSGAFLFRIGRSGAGPGELSYPCCLAFDDAHRLWVRDRGNGRFNIYTVGSERASYVRSISLAGGGGGRHVPVVFDPEGNPVDVMGLPAGDGRESFRRIHLDTSGAVVAETDIPAPPDGSADVVTLGRRGGRSFTTHAIFPLFGARHLVGHSPRGEWAEAISTQYLVLWYRADGTLVRAVRRANVVGPPVRDADRERQERIYRETGAEIGANLRDLMAEVPDRKPPLRALFFDADGRLWIVRRTRSGEPSRADVIDRTGAFAATVEWPQGVELRNGYVRGRTALGIRRGRLGVERIVRLRF